MTEFFEKLNSVGAMTPFIWTVVLFYFIMLTNQLVYFISRPDDKERFRYVITMIFYIIYNINTGYLPDERINLNYTLQIQIAYSFPILMAYYFTYYIYKLLQINNLHRLLIKTPIFTLLIPYFVLFLIPYLITKNEKLASYLITIVPGSYAIFALFRLNYLVIKQYREQNNKVNHFLLKVISSNLGILAHLGLAVTQFFENESIEVITVNIGFVLMSFVFLIIIIIDNQKEHDKLLESEKALQEYNLQLEQKVQQRTNELREANEQRVNTFIKLAHETRTPLTLIKNNIDEYYKTKRGDDRNIESMRFNTEKLHKQLNNILNIEKIQKGLPIYNHSKIIDLTRFVSEKVTLFKPFALKKEICIKENIQGNIYILADPDAIDSLINNLIENAIKYTDVKGNVLITLRSDGQSITFSVKDSGFGISKEYHQRIFDPYFHVPKHGIGNHGLGIGLSIVQSIVKSLGGEIKVKSQPNTGSEFIVKLSHYKSTKIINPDPYILKTPVIEDFDKSVEDAFGNPQKPGILIIEDNIDLLAYLRNKLMVDYNIYVTLNGNEAVKKLKEAEYIPDLIISDVMMDGMDGIKFFDYLRNSKFSHIPLIFITAKTNPVDRDNALAAGAIDYIYKPFEISEVRNKISSIISNSRKQRNSTILAIKNYLDIQSQNHSQLNPEDADNFHSNCILHGISNREGEIIKLAQKGKTYSEIAETLHISPKTVDTHFQKIYKKVGVSRKQELFNIFFGIADSRKN